MEVENRFKAMGTDVHLIINGEEKHSSYARRRLEDLENKWSRFLPYSEITKLNESNGEPFKVSQDTAELIAKAIEGIEITKGLFNPTILGDLLRLGYTESYENIDAAKNADNTFVTSSHGIQLESEIVTLTNGVGFDPGGIGKGLAADLIANELIDSGALGALINIGGDVRLIGKPFHGEGWKIEIADSDQSIIETVAVDEGAVATSTTKKRTWEHEGTQVNHLVDPESGMNPISDVVLASVIASQGWQAEILTKVLMIGNVDEGLLLIDELGAQGLALSDKAEIKTTSGWTHFRQE